MATGTAASRQRIALKAGSSLRGRCFDDVVVSVPFLSFKEKTVKNHEPHKLKNHRQL